MQLARRPWAGYRSRRDSKLLFRAAADLPSPRERRWSRESRVKALAKARGAPDIPRPQFAQRQSSSVVEQRFRKPQVKGSIPFSGSSVWEAVGAGGEGNQDRVECKADEERARRLRDSVIRQPSFFQPARLIPSAAANVSFSHCANGAHSAQVAHVCTRRRCVST